VSKITMKKSIAVQTAVGESKAKTSLLPRYSLYLPIILAVAAAAIYAHVRVSQAGLDYTGPLALLDRLFDLLFTVFILATAFCAGRAAARLFAIKFAGAAEELAFSTMIGSGALGLGMLGLGLAGQLRPIPVALFILLLVAVARGEVKSLLSVAQSLRRSAAATKGSRALAALFAFLILLLVVRAAAPPHNYDEAIYHLSVSKLFAQRGSVFPVEDNWAGNMPFLVQMIYAIFLLAKADIAAKFFSLFLGVTCAVALYGFSARFLNRTVGLISMFAFFGAGMVIEVAVTTRIDLSLAGMLFLAAYAMMAHLESGERGWLYASAILSGLSLGIKYSAGGWVALIVVMYLVESLRAKRETLTTILKRSVMFGAIALALTSPWLIKNLVWFHNPVYPFVTGEAAEFGADGPRYFNAEDEQRLQAHFQAAQIERQQDIARIASELVNEAATREQRYPLRFWEYFIWPDKYNMAEPYHDPNYLFLAAPLLIFLRKPRWLVWLTVFAVGFFLFAASSTWIARILLPVYPALTIIAAFVLAELVARVKARAPIIAALPAALVAVAVGSAVFVSAAQTYNAGGLSFITGSLSRREFMRAAFYYPPIDFINRSTLKDARVMMIGAQMCYDLERDYLADVNWDTTEWRRLLARNPTLDDAHQDLKRRGVTHILFSPGLFKFAAKMGRNGLPDVSHSTAKSGVDYQEQFRNWATFDHYRSRYLVPVFTHNDYLVYSLK
jgi:dolichyl-phosphate-mannose-protein mannosyltransferase